MDHKTLPLIYSRILIVRRLGKTVGFPWQHRAQWRQSKPIIRPWRDFLDSRCLYRPLCHKQVDGPYRRQKWWPLWVVGTLATPVECSGSRYEPSQTLDRIAMKSCCYHCRHSPLLVIGWAITTRVYDLTSIGGGGRDGGGAVNGGTPSCCCCCCCCGYWATTARRLRRLCHSSPATANIVSIAAVPPNAEYDRLRIG